MNDPSACHAIVRGLVQGVYFRRFAAVKAAGLGLTGYARNLPDGSVEVHAEGEIEQLRRLVVYLHQGPPDASVTAVEASWSDYTGEYPDFGIRH